MARTLFCTVSDDRFAPGCKVMLYSLQRHCSEFSRADVRVFYDDALSPLSAGSQHSIRSAVPQVEFEAVECGAYRTAKVPRECRRPAYLALETFRQSDYEHVIFVDADMLCLADISPVLKQTHDCDFLACAAWRDAGNPYHQVGRHVGRWAQRRWFGMFGRRRVILNTGFFWVGKPFRTSAVYRALLQHVCRRTSKRGLTDQWAINTFFGTRQARLNLLPDTYNWRDLRAFGTPGMAESPKILHYVGGRQQPKPWLPGAPRDLPAYRLWQEYAADCDRHVAGCAA
jgi:hypothetical protein